MGAPPVPESAAPGGEPAGPRIAGKHLESPWADVLREITAVRVEKGPRVDGRLDDRVWELAPDGGPLVQADPHEGAEPTERTSFRILYDDEALYVGFWCHDSEPERIVAVEMARDGRLSADDYVAFVIDTFHDRRNGYQFRVNPNGARADSLISDNVNLNDNWDGIWQAAATIDSQGWKAEIAIPFKTLSFDSRSDAWGFNVFRQIKRRAEKNRWMAARREISTHNVAEAGRLVGLRGPEPGVGLEQGLGLDVTPYALGRYRHDFGSNSDVFSGDAGGDIRYRITPSLTSILSVNMDFAETEVDARQINLTRFPLFYPEKRDFFLEDAGIFGFGGIHYSPLPFYSRRIGLTEDGARVPILVAGKLTGRESGFNVGALDALVDEHDDVGIRNAFVGRVSRNIFEQSSLGGIVTAGDPNSPDENVLGGIDFGYRTTTLLGDHVLQANAFGMGTYTENARNDDGLSFGAEVELPNDIYSARAEFYQVGEDFNPALGFAPRRGVRAYIGSLGYKPRTESIEWIRNFYFSFSTSNFTDLSNDLETSYQSLYPLWVELESADQIFFNIVRQFDGPEDDFEISPGVVIPADGYWWTSYRAGFQSASKRPVEAGLYYSFGGFYDGEKDGYSAALDLKPWKHLTFVLAYSLNEVRLPGGDFNTQLASIRMKISFNPDMIWYHLVQYDNQSDVLGYNTRFVWEFRPGATLYLVFNQTAERESSRLSWLESELTAKVGMTFRF